MSGSNSSATGGFITARMPVPPTAGQFEAMLQSMVSTLSALPGNLVRPRWQHVPPTQPPPETNWASVGVVRQERDDYPYIIHHSDTLPGEPHPGYDEMQRHLTHYIVATFYGDEAEDYGGLLREGLYMAQNWEPWAPLGVKLRDAEIHMQRAPEWINNQYINRIDVSFVLRQMIVRYYPIYNIERANILMQADIEDLRRIVVVPPRAAGRRDVVWDYGLTIWDEGATTWPE